MDLSRIRYKIMKRLRGTVCASRALGCSIGENCRILSDIATSEPWLVTVGDRVTISSGVRFITHDGTGSLHRDDKGRRYRYAPVRIGSDVFIGANAVVLPGVAVGNCCVIGAGSVVTKSVPDGTVVAGNPARPLSSWDDLHAKMATWPSASDMRGTSYRERVDSIAEKLPETREDGPMTGNIHITGDDSADQLLSDDPLALLIGMLLDQQVSMESAFSGPLKIRERLGSFDAASIAGQDPDAFAELFRTPPAVHRYPANMAERVQTLCRVIVDDWGGDASEIWTRGAPDGPEVLKRLKALPGFGEQKARIFLALLGKQYGFTGSGWREAAGSYGDEGSYRSVADIVDPDSLTRVREFKRSAKAAAKAASSG